MRARPFAFLRLGNRWVNMALVTDIVDDGDTLTLFMTTDQARLAGGDHPQPVDVARRYTLRDPEDVDKLQKWLRLNDED